MRTKLATVATLRESLSGPALCCVASKLTNARQVIQLCIKGHLDIQYCFDAVSLFCRDLEWPGPW
jgi:hypothetical protein